VSTAPVTKHELVIESFDQITMKQIQWAWPGRMPLEAITTFAGYPGIGKGLVTVYIAATLTTGRDFPDAPNPFGEPCDVLFLSGEDDAASVIKPRLVAAGADVTRVHRIKSMLLTDLKQNRSVHLDTDAAYIKRYLQEHPEIRLVVIDPVTDHLGKKNYLNDQEMRDLLNPIITQGVAVLLVAHLNKKEGLNADGRQSELPTNDN